MELRKHQRFGANEAAPISDSSSASDEEGSAFEEVDEGTDNSASSLSLSLEAEVTESSGDVDITVLRSKHAHEKGVSRTPHGRRRKKRGVTPVREMRLKRVHDKGGCSEVESQIPSRSLGKVDNVQGKRERERGNKGKSGVEEGMVVEKEGEGIGDVIVRHRCALEAVCGLNFELEEYQKSAIEGIMLSLVLKYKPFVMDKHLVHALMESWVPESKAFRIGRREVPLSVYDVALLTGLPATGKHVTFDQGEGLYGVEDVVKAAMDDHLNRERARRRTGRADMRMYRNYVSVIFKLSLWSFLVEAIEDTKEKIPLKRNLQMYGFTMVVQVWFYEHKTLYAHADEKGVSCIASWVNLYIGYQYDAAQLISTIKDNQGIISIKECLRGMREALRITIETLTLERASHIATKKELEHIRALLIGRGQGDSLPGGTQNEGLQCADEDGEGSMHARDRRLSTSQGDDRYSFYTNFHTADMGSAEDAHECEPFGDPMQPDGENEMVVSPHATEEDVVPTLECNTEQPHADDIGIEGDIRMAGEGGSSSIAKRVRRSPRQRSRYHRSPIRLPLHARGSAEWGMHTRPENDSRRRPPTQAKSKRRKRYGAVHDNQTT
ncbi:hypothetical protein Cgig2_018413 [Carnegiea gigantea]|uniref:Uncharacterized protein n=1 Tax=Carnegiea gigantea TaxID=171969 RepID=A0A9Q1JTG0_9CARY|nr:hypothetical protein Cgig2_018413 [Carnegiea gigantea]